MGHMGYQGFILSKPPTALWSETRRISFTQQHRSSYLNATLGFSPIETARVIYGKTTGKYKLLLKTHGHFIFLLAWESIENNPKNEKIVKLPFL